MQELIDRYNRLVVRYSYSYWSWTGGSVTRSAMDRDGEATTRGKMIAQTARVLDAHENTVRAYRTNVDEVRKSGEDIYWILDRSGGLSMAVRADGRPASWRYAYTLAQRYGAQRLRSREALAVACQRLRETEATHQAIHDVMYELLGLEPIHCPTCEEMWPKSYSITD